MGTGHICHPCISRSYNGDVDRYPCIYPCWALPYVELQTHEVFPLGSQILAPLLATSFTRCIWWLLTWFNDPHERDPGYSGLSLLDNIPGHKSTERLMHTTSLCPWVSYDSFALDKSPCLGGHILQWLSRYEMTLLDSSWFALGLDSTYVCGYQGALLPVELSQRHSLLFLRKVSKPTTHPDIGATKTFKQHLTWGGHSCCIVSQ